MKLFSFKKRSESKPDAHRVTVSTSPELADDSVRRGATPAWYWAQDPALGVATVYRCVKLLSDSVGNLPLLYKKMNNDGIFQEQRFDPLWYLLNVEPDAGINSFDFWSNATAQMLLHGNTYIVPVISPETMRYSRLVLCHPNTVQHNLVTDMYHISDSEAGMFGDFKESEIIHFSGLGYNPKHGLSVLQFARQTMAIAGASNTETLNRVENGGTIKGILSYDTAGTPGWGEVQDIELDKLADRVNSEINGNKGLVGVNGNVRVSTMSMTAADMQFLETIKFNVREICRFFGVHPSFVFDDTSNNYKSAEMANVAFLSNTLNPLLRKMEIELLRKLFSPTAAPYRKIEFNRMGLYASDLESRINYQTKQIQAGLATPNELRRLEDKLPVPGGDEVFISANLKNIREISL